MCPSFDASDNDRILRDEPQLLLSESLLHILLPSFLVESTLVISIPKHTTHTHYT